MRNKSNNDHEGRAGVFSRLFWGLMILAHAPGLIAAGRAGLMNGFGVELLSGSVLLVASMVFFVLKIRGVPWLRLQTNRRSVIAVCLVVMLIHLECIRPGLRGELLSQCTVVLVTTSLVFAVPRGVRRVRSSLASRHSSSSLRSFDDRPTGVIWLDSYRPRCWVLVLSLLRLRAPPA